ncbi:MAG TPA: ankyrin repeat domain-containing protein [Chlamydiales bacterium]|nr:ankyrin repeat domain-containing protein [Chlamydiales bacterium]
MNSSSSISTYLNDYRYASQPNVARISSAGTLARQNIFPVASSSEKKSPAFPDQLRGRILPNTMPVKKMSKAGQIDTAHSKTDVSGVLSQSEIVNQVIGKVNALFSEPARRIYETRLLETQDINTQYDGFSLLHYCAYCFSALGKSMENKFLDLIQYLIQHDAKITQDQYGRTPIYFASSSNPRYWDLLCNHQQICDLDNNLVQPLHVIASFKDKFVFNLIQRGANTDVVDKFGRMPLHCAVLHEDFHGKFFNVKCLVDYEPKSLEHADHFGNYPLDYAALFGSDDLFEFVLKHSSRTVVQAVFDRFKSQNMLKVPNVLFALKEKYGVYDPIYNVPPLLKIMYGGGKNKKQNSEARIKGFEKAVQEKKITISHAGVQYDAYHDGHGYKHCIHQNDYNKKYKNDKKRFIQSTLSGAAKFYPFPFSYDNLIYLCVESWIKKGADDKKPYVKFPDAIGADNGNETNVVEIYFSASGGAHVRPKDITLP